MADDRSHSFRQQLGLAAATLGMLGAMVLGMSTPADAGEGGSECHGMVCRIEGPGGVSALLVIKSGVDRAQGRRQVTRAFRGADPAAALVRYRNGGAWPTGLCASACAVTAAILYSTGALIADPRSAYCWCHPPGGSLDTFRSHLPSRWLRLLRTGRPFFYAEVAR